MQNAVSLDVPINALSAGLLDHKKIKRVLTMGSVIVSFKIFPVDITVDFDELEKKIEDSLPNFASIYGTGKEPVAYGLNALILHVKIPEGKSGVLDEIEQGFENLEEISQVQPGMVRRTSQ